jgi:hypothetical protein
MAASCPKLDPSYTNFINNHGLYTAIVTDLKCDIIFNNGALKFWYRGIPYPMGYDNDDDIAYYREFMREDAIRRGVFMVIYPAMNGYVGPIM